jgi:hypothetical protein
MLTNTAINPSYGSSTSYTYTIDSVGPPLYFSPNVVNTYRFRIAASYGSITGSSSATTTVQGPTNVTVTAGTPGPTSVPLSWTASTGANRYMVYYAVSGDALSLYAGTSNLSTTVSGLTPGTDYEFRVQPITGTSNNTGYYGNYSNIASATTSADLTNTVAPTISGTLTEGQTISMSNGSWNLTPDSYTYQWLYYNGDPGTGYEGYVAITGATSSSYTIPTNYRDVYGSLIRARVTAIKSGYTSKNAYSSGQTVSYDATLPQPPTGLSVSDVGINRPYSNAAYDLSWTAPTDTGGVSLSGYKIQFQVPSTGSTWYNWSSNTVDTTSTSITLTGFGSNLSTNFRVYSVNSVGQSASPVTTASPVLGTTVPQAPTIGTASSSNTYIAVTYTANATGGKSITSYTATSSPGSLTGSTSSGAIVVYNVVHNTAYTFTVTATNANGTSAASSASNTAYGVNIGSVTNITSSSTSSSITLNFTKATNSTSTRGYLNGSLDGTTTGTSYLFAGLSASTSYSLGLAGTAVVNGVTYVGPQSSGSYTTSAPPAVSVNSYPTISGTGVAGTNISFTAGSYNNASTVSVALVVSLNTSFSTSSGVKTSTSPYTVTTGDATSPAYYFATRTTVVGTNGITYYFWSGGYSGSSVTLPSGGGSILSSLPTYTVTWNANGGSVSPTSNSVTAGGSVTAPTPTRSGYTFLYWRDTPSLDYTYSVNAGGSFTPPSSITMYARWQAAATAPATPTGVSVSVSGTVTWTASSGATSYTVEWYAARNSTGTLGSPTVLGPYYYYPTGTSQVITYPSSGGSTYSYVRARVSATNSAGTSSYSAWYPSSTSYV